MPQTYSRQPITCRTKPSTAAIGASPSRYARSARSATSSGCSSPRFSDEDRCECHMKRSPASMAS